MNGSNNTINNFILSGGFDFYGFEQNSKPKKQTQRIESTSDKKQTTQDYEKFFGKSLIALLGQGPIKKEPKRSEARIKRQKEQKNIPLTAEEEKEIRILFGDNQNDIC